MRELEVVILLILCGFCIGFGLDVFFTFRKEINRIDEGLNNVSNREKKIGNIWKLKQDSTSHFLKLIQKA